MSEVLQLTVDGSSPRRLGVPEAVFDAATSAAIEQRLAAARAEAFAEGEAAGRAAVHAEVEALRSFVAATATTVTDELHAQRDQATAIHLDLARRVAEAVLDRSVAPDADELLERIRSAVTALDVDEVQIRVHPDHHAHLSEVAEGAGFTWLPDPTLAPGDACIDGGTCGVDLRRGALVAAALDLLSEASS